MRTGVDSDLWRSIYPNLRDHCMADPRCRARAIADDGFFSWAPVLEAEFLEMGIRIEKDGSRWTHVDLPDGEELIALIMRWS